MHSTGGSVAWDAASRGGGTRGGGAWERLSAAVEPVLAYKELLRRAAVTLGMMALLRLGCYVPLPMVNRAALGAAAYGLGNSYGTLYHLGIMPYIFAGLTLQLLEVAKAPIMAQCKEDGVEGYWKLVMINNILGASIGIFQGVYDALDMQHAAVHPKWFFIRTAATMAAGSCIMNYCASVVDVHGIGDGLSIALCMNIVAGYGELLAGIWQHVQAVGIPPWKVGVALVGYSALVGAMVLINSTQLRVPMVYYKMRRVKGSSSSPLASLVDRSLQPASEETNAEATAYIPLRLTRGLSSLLFASYGLEVLQNLGYSISASAMARFHASWAYLATFAAAVFVMELAGPNWSSAEAMADYLTKIEAGIDGVSPGEETMRYIRGQERLCRFWGALCLTGVLVAVQLIDRGCFGTMYASPGTGLLLIVSLVASASRQVKSLTLAPRIEQRLLQQRRALEYMVNTTPGMNGPGL